MAVAGREMSCRAIVTGMVVDAAEAECLEFDIEAEPKEQHSCCLDDFKDKWVGNKNIVGNQNNLRAS
uniref:Uncharacterized protein n=1 Tax=Oryza nivara TaxID=4536 RepID=A0A0E0HCY1_ORYNI